MKKIIALSLALFLSHVAAQAAIAKSYTDVKKFLVNLNATYPNTTKLMDLALSDSGDTIKIVAIGNGPIHNMVVSTHHGNEYGSTEVAMAFAESLAKAPIEGQTVYVIPVLNISGYNARNRYESFAGDSQDPNRDYPGPCGTDGPFKLKSTHALANFIDQQNIVASATLHTYYPAVVYPWGISSHDLTTPYQSTFEQLVKDATVESKYQTGNSTEVIYAADGTYEDYAFWKHGIWSILFELGFTHTPSQSEVDTMVTVNVPGLRRLLQNAPTARAADHDFHGKCDGRMRSHDRHDE